jgi:hypothetical protein
VPKFARFLKKGQFSATKHRVKRNGLEPMFNKEAKRLETSVFFFDSRSLDEMWHVGDDNLEWTPTALGSSFAAEMEKHALTVARDDNPPGHAVIVGWPEAKVDYLDVAVKLEKCFSLAVRQP